jgi:hypothetical protein
MEKQLTQKMKDAGINRKQESMIREIIREELLKPNRINGQKIFMNLGLPSLTKAKKFILPNESKKIIDNLFRSAKTRLKNKNHEPK